MCELDGMNNCKKEDAMLPPLFASDAVSAAVVWDFVAAAVVFLRLER